MIPEDLSEAFTVRNCRPEDQSSVIAVMKEWWGGRDLVHALPRLFFDHFTDSSFVVFHENDLVAFLIGFLSQSCPDEGYIHFAGVHPAFRKIGLAARLYGLFFDYCRNRSRTTVRCCTAPVNKLSIRFHKKMGFVIEPGDAVIDGVSVRRDYNRPGDDKVRFVKKI